MWHTCSLKFEPDVKDKAIWYTQGACLVDERENGIWDNILDLKNLIKGFRV